jgi:hypothetical protein
LSLEGRFQLKLGPVAIRDTFMARRYDFTSEANEVFFFDQNTDLLAPTHGWIWTHDVDLLMLAPNGITLGARLSTGMGVEMTHRLGPILAFTWYNRPGQTFNTPTIFVISQWHVAHPYRAGAVSSQWSPTVAFGFAFSGDLTPW